MATNWNHRSIRLPRPDFALDLPQTIFNRRPRLYKRGHIQLKPFHHGLFYGIQIYWFRLACFEGHHLPCNMNIESVPAFRMWGTLFRIVIASFIPEIRAQSCRKFRY